MTKQLYHFEDVETILNNVELKMMWKVLKLRELKLKDIRFSVHCDSGIGTNFFMHTKIEEKIADITDYFSW